MQLNKVSDVREVALQFSEGVPIQRENLHAFEAKINGYQRTFKLYLPNNYNGAGLFPLVAVNHGGETHDIYQYTPWHLLAEREGLIILYPECWVEHTPWNIWNLLDEFGRYPDDVAYIDALLDYVCQTYCVDQTRIYMCGHSMGDGMTTTYALHHPERLAAASSNQGPSKTMWMFYSDGTWRAQPSGAVPMLRTHGEDDCFYPKALSDAYCKRYKQQCHIFFNNLLWHQANHCGTSFQIGTSLTKNEVRYEGAAETSFITYVHGKHRPPISYAEDIWERYFSRYRRVNGRLECLRPSEELDRGAIAVCSGTGNALVNHQLVHGQSPLHPCYLGENQTLLFDVRLLSVFFGPNTVEWAKDRQSIMLRLPGQEITIYRPFLPNRCKDGMYCVLCVNGKYDTVVGAEILDDTWMLPFRMFMENALHLFVDERYGAAYAVSHPLNLTYDLAFFIKQVLGVEKPLSAKDAYDLEQGIFLMEREDLGIGAPQSAREQMIQWIHI